MSPEGHRNLAPFSFFGAFSFDPPTIGLGPGSRRGVDNDSLENIKATEEFVVNLLDGSLPEIDAWDAAGAPIPSDVARSVRIAEAHAALECRVRQIIDLGDAERSSNHLVVAWIERVHLRDDVLDGDRFPLPRPESDDPEVLALDLRCRRRGATP